SSTPALARLLSTVHVALLGTVPPAYSTSPIQTVRSRGLDLPTLRSAAAELPPWPYDLSAKSHLNKSLPWDGWDPQRAPAEALSQLPRLDRSSNIFPQEKNELLENPGVFSESPDTVQSLHHIFHLQHRRQPSWQE